MTELFAFCLRYGLPDSVTCQEHLTLTMTGTVVTRGFCLPASCADSKSLQEIAASSYKLYCDNDIKVDGQGYCDVSHMSMNCTSESLILVIFSVMSFLLRIMLW